MTTQPNILLLTDQQRHDSLGCYGFLTAHTSTASPRRPGWPLIPTLFEPFLMSATPEHPALCRRLLIQTAVTSSIARVVAEVGWFPKEKLQSMTVYPVCLKTEFWDLRNLSPIPTRHLGTDIRKKKEAFQATSAKASVA